MRRCTLILTTLFGLLSCNSDSDRTSDINTLLTSTEWTVPVDADDKENLKGIWSFKEDGTYIENFDKMENTDKIVLKGNWKWISESEVSVVYKSMVLNGENHKLNDNDDYYYILRITELTKKNLKMIKRFNGDSEDSGFAKELTYIAAEM